MLCSTDWLRAICFKKQNLGLGVLARSGDIVGVRTLNYIQINIEQYIAMLNINIMVLAFDLSQARDKC